MANEGIMALPQSAAMQDEGGEQQPQMVTSFDSYDAAQTALGMVNPGELSALKESLRQNMADLQLTPSQLTTLIEIFEYVSQNPREYKTIREDLIRNDFVDAEDLPEEYDPEFLGAILAVLNELKMTMAQGAQAPMMEEPPIAGMEGMQPMAMAEGGLADVASFLAAQGRNGDKILAHITPEEAQFLKERGGAGTINPVTGLPEYFLKKIFNAVKSVVKGVTNVVKKVLKSPVGRILATIALATVLGPTAIGMTLGTAGTTALASSAVTLAGGGSIKEALVAGAMGYIGGGGTIMGANPISAVGQYLPGAAGGALNTGLATGVISTGVGKLAGMSTQDALRMGLTSGLTAGAMKGIEGLRAEQAVKTGPVGTASDLVSPVEVTGTDQAARFMPFQGGPSTPQGAAYDAALRGDFGRVAELQQMFPDQIRGQYTYDMGGGARSFSMPTDQPMSRFTQTPLPSSSGTTGTAQDLLGGGLKPGSQIGFRAPASYPFGSTDYSSAIGGTGAQTNYSLLPTATPVGSEGLRVGPFTSRDLSSAMGGTGATTNYSLVPRAAPAVTPAAPSGFVDRAIAGAKNIYNEYLSPSRPGLPADAGILRKYGPLVATGTVVAGAAGAMKSDPANPNPAFNRNYTGFDYLRDNPDMFQGGLDTYTPPSTPNPVVVPTPSYASIPVGQPGVVVPMGATMSPGGVSQPYNVAGLYGVPLIYGQRPPGYAKGGELRPTDFPRKNGPINGPGTGTSDSIPAMLSDGEFVFTAKAVRNAGNGSRRKGAARMYKLMKMLEGGPVKAK